jgi:hypothetical protein
MLCISFHCRSSNKWDARCTDQHDADLMEKLGGRDTPDLPTAPWRNTTPKTSNHIATSSAVFTPEGDKPQQNCGTNNNSNEHVGTIEDSRQEEHPEYVNTGTAKGKKISRLQKLEQRGPDNANIITAAPNNALRHDTESTVIASSDEEMSLDTVDPPHAISQEIEYLLLQHEKCLIAELCDALLRLPAPSSSGRKHKSLFTLPHSGVSPPPE